MPNKALAITRASVSFTGGRGAMAMSVGVMRDPCWLDGESASILTHAIAGDGLH